MIGDNIHRAILALRAEGKTFQQIGDVLGLSKQAVYERLKATPPRLPLGRPQQTNVTAVLATTNRLLAGLIVQTMRLQSYDREREIDRLRGFGLSSREIGEAIGTSEATVNATTGRARREKRSESPESSAAGDPVSRVITG